jgi:rhamnogalacturonan hydrolase
MFLTHFFAAFAAFSALTSAQSTNLEGKVGPLTSIADKKAIKICDITDYGGKVGSDISTAINDAFAACQKGGVVVIPSGNYNLEDWVVLKDGEAWALQLDGIITRTGKAEGKMIFIEHTSDFELFSTTSKGAIQGHGYEFHKNGSISGPRLLRLYEVSDFAVHDIALVDSPSFHLSMDTCTNGEVYNMAIRGGAHGGLDGIDVWSENIWIHDVMVTNKVRSSFRSSLFLALTVAIGRVCHGQISCKEHSCRKRVLQLVWRLCNGILGAGRGSLQHHLP